MPSSGTEPTPGRCLSDGQCGGERSAWTLFAQGFSEDLVSLLKISELLCLKCVPTNRMFIAPKGNT